MRRRLIYLIMVVSLWVLIEGRSFSQSIIDVRNIRPNVMLLLDTSGSMEWKDQNYTYPRCTGNYNAQLPDEKNRWITLVEILTGTFNNYACIEEPRRDPHRLDYGYFIPHFKPICVNYYLPNSPLPYSNPNCQLQDGLLDLYKNEIKFGLMTFDSNPDTSTEIEGMWSYGPDKRFGNDTCEYRWNLGAKRYERYNYPNQCRLDQATADPFRDFYGQDRSTDIEGELISVGYEGDNIDASLLDRINTWIQHEILSIKPFWGTPISALLDDAEYYFRTHPDVRPLSNGGCDCYYNCRKRYVILFTDGMPNLDGRPRCTLGVDCPYDYPEREAADLYALDIPVFVIGFNIDQAEATDPRGYTPRQLLNLIAREGGSCCRLDPATGETLECGVNCDPDTDQNCRCALFADDRDTLRRAFSEIFDYVSDQAISHTRTATTTQITDYTTACQGSICPVQYQFNTSLTIQSGRDPETGQILPWIGNLERTSYICQDDGNGNLIPVEWRLDNYGEFLNEQDDRYIYTLTPDQPQRVLENNDQLILPTRFTENNITPEMLGLNQNDTERRDQVIAWMRGDEGTSREHAKLGAIYHANPAIIGPPNQDLPIESYYAGPHISRGSRDPINVGFKIQYGDPQFQKRPNVIYVNTLDGMLHAFEVEGNPPENTPRELWSYIPGMLLKKLPDNLNGNQFLLDGTPIVKDVRLWKSSHVGGIDVWATVLVSGLRHGGGVRGYFALDVTYVQDGSINPSDPGFRVMWEITNETEGFERLGLSYPDPLIGTVFIEDEDRNDLLGEVAVAIIPGGYWPDTEAEEQGVGNVIYIVKLENGRLIKAIPAPPGYEDTQFVSTPFGYNILTGTITTKVFIGDNHGRLWRLDLSSTDPDEWELQLFYDLGVNQPIFLAPVGALNQEGELVLIVATGDTDNLTTLGTNKIVSITEKVTYDATGQVVRVEPHLNWELAFGETEIDGEIIGNQGERVTGSPVIFNEVVYFTTFVPHEDPEDCCTLGYGRLWGIHYIGDDPNSTTDLIPELDPDPDDPDDNPVRFIDLVDRNGNRENTIAFGPSIIRRPSCAIEQRTVDEFNQPIVRLINTTPPEYELVVQVNSPGERKNIGGKERITQTITRKLQPPPPVTVADSWATIFGY